MHLIDVYYILLSTPTHHLPGCVLHLLVFVMRVLFLCVFVLLHQYPLFSSFMRPHLLDRRKYPPLCPTSLRSTKVCGTRRGANARCPPIQLDFPSMVHLWLFIGESFSRYSIESNQVLDFRTWILRNERIEESDRCV